MTSLTGNSGMRGARGAAPGEYIPSGYRKGTLNNFDTQQTGLYNQLYQHVGPDSYLNKLASGDQSTFEQMEAPAWRDFATAQGDVASRFSGMGTGARNSSGFQNTMSSASSNFAQELQANRQNLQRQALQDLRGMSMELLNQRPQQNFIYEKRQKKPNPWAGIAGGAVGAVGGSFFGNPMGGAALGYNIGNAFGGGGQTQQGQGGYGKFGEFRNPLTDFALQGGIG